MHFYSMISLTFSNRDTIDLERELEIHEAQQFGST